MYLGLYDEFILLIIIIIIKFVIIIIKKMEKNQINIKIR
jgi:hypothetical protein